MLLQGTRLYRRQHVRDWTPSDQRELQVKALNPNPNPHHPLLQLTLYFVLAFGRLCEELLACMGNPSA